MQRHKTCRFVQLTSVHPVWCLLYARCAFCAGRKACVFLGTEPWLRCGILWFSCYKKLHVFFSIRAKATTPLMTNSDVLRLLSSIERGTPSGGAPAHFASFYPFYSLQAFTAALRASVSLQGFCLRFSVQARLARLLRASRASECVFQCKHGWHGFCEPPGLLVTFFSTSTAGTVLRLYATPATCDSV